MIKSSVEAGYAGDLIAFHSHDLLHVTIEEDRVMHMSPCGMWLKPAYYYWDKFAAEGIYHDEK